MSKIHAPVALFVFARPYHTRLTLQALARNVSAEQTDLIIYSDAARNETEAESVSEVRSLVRLASGFRSVTMVERETNYGLARNIIEGVTDVSQQYGRLIVLEDDIVTSRGFLGFMNAALEQYAEQQRVWHISGWNYPIESEGLSDTFFWPVVNCWGWGTWADRWRYFEKNPRRLVVSWSAEKIRRFNLDGASDFWRQVTENHTGTLNTWAVFWYATIFERDGLCLNPSQTFVRNIGNDGSGENCGNNNYFGSTMSDRSVEFSNVFETSELAVQRIKSFYKGMRGGLPQRMARAVKNLLKGNAWR